MRLVFNGSREQWRDLEALAYWVHVCGEAVRYGDVHCEKSARDSLTWLAGVLDRGGVPWWVQNAVAAWASDRVRYLGEYMLPWLARRGYGVIGDYTITCGEA